MPKRIFFHNSWRKIPDLKSGKKRRKSSFYRVILAKCSNSQNLRGYFFQSTIGILFVFPDIWKLANVIPIIKKGNKYQPSNYRPVALLSCIGRLQERIVSKNMYNFLFDNNLLFKYQSSFLPHHSTVFQLIDIFHNICQAFDNNIFSCNVFFDVSKAFDRVWHKGILFKLRQMALMGNF